MTNEKQRFACSAINSVVIELDRFADKKGVIHIRSDDLEEITMRLKREIRSG
jgi:hypothetical protein